MLLTKTFLYGRLLYIGTEKTKNESEAENVQYNNIKNISKKIWIF